MLSSYYAWLKIVVIIALAIIFGIFSYFEYVEFAGKLEIVK